MLDLVKVKCSSCGAENEIIPGTVAAECDFCHASLNLKKTAGSTSSAGSEFEFSMNFETKSSNDDYKPLFFSSLGEEPEKPSYVTAVPFKTEEERPESPPPPAPERIQSESLADIIKNRKIKTDSNERDSGNSSTTPSSDNTAAGLFFSQSSTVKKPVSAASSTESIEPENNSKGFSEEEPIASKARKNGDMAVPLAKVEVYSPPPVAPKATNPPPNYSAPVNSPIRPSARETQGSMVGVVGILFVVFIIGLGAYFTSSNRSRTKNRYNRYNKKYTTTYQTKTTNNQTKTSNNQKYSAKQPTTHNFELKSWKRFLNNESKIIEKNKLTALDEFVEKYNAPIIKKGKGTSVYLFYPYTYIGIARLRQIGGYIDKIKSEDLRKIRIVEIPHTGESKIDAREILSAWTVYRLGGPTAYNYFKAGIMGTTNWRLKGRVMKTLLELATKSGINAKEFEDSIKTKKDQFRLKAAAEYVRILQVTSNDFTLIVGNRKYPARSIDRLPYIVENTHRFGTDPK